MGPGFESPEVHHPTVSGPKDRGHAEGTPKGIPEGKEGADFKRERGRRADESVLLTQWVHPFPFRTRKLSAAVVKILGWRRPGKITHSRHKRIEGKLNKFPFLCKISNIPP